MTRLLEVDQLSVSFLQEGGAREALSGVSFDMRPGEILGVVGESGSGKSVTALAVMRLLGEQGMVTAGAIRLEGEDLLSLDDDAVRATRGKRIAMIFQEPMTSLNPLLTVGFQIEEVLRAHFSMSDAETRARSIRLIEDVGIPNPEIRHAEYPFRLSGGMRQRVMIAMAIACEPKLLIADEPTTALDVTIQAQILELMKRLRREHGSAILLITHDMGVIARMAERVVVMYAGEVVEIAPARALFARPAHPYARLLLAAMPTAKRKTARLPVIAGQMPAPGAVTRGCRFRARCPDAVAICGEQAPALQPLSDDRQARCWRAAELMSAA
jgi:peptide/nickel transport system ATP-binding protein